MNAGQKTYHFRSRRPADEDVPSEWRSLDWAVSEWVRIHGGSEPLAQLAAWTSVAEGRGDSALPLAGRPEWTEETKAEPMVTVISSNQQTDVKTPFVVEHEHFYLRRNHAHEVAVANALRRRRKTFADPLQPSSEDVSALFGKDAMRPENRLQRDAVARVLGRRLFILTGGPGTGKTTTVLRMLLMLIDDRATRGLAAPVIRISAPTGKAAQRLSESLRSGAQGLRQGELESRWQRHLEVALAADASTLHRLLGSRGASGGFRFHAGDPLPADVVVIDEASMVDLAMLRALLDALREDAVLILVGDADQLTSVGTGSVLMDLVAVLEEAQAPELVRLTHSFRADRSLVPINEAILHGDEVALAKAMAAAGQKAARTPVATAAELKDMLHSWGKELHEVLKEGRAFEEVPDGNSERVLQALDALKKRQLLCALREGEFGAIQANAQLETVLRKKAKERAGEEWYPGRAVMVTRNDASAGLFNGDVGICLRDEDGLLKVWFEVTDATQARSDSAPGASSHRSVRAFAPGSLPEHQGAFAVTIHKSQGSEYEHVVLLLPKDPENRILSRQLLYTGASRAKNVVEFWATDEVVSAAIARRVERAGGLRQRLS